MNTFKALADPIRQEILTMLKQKKLSAGEIASVFDMSQATISYHLSILKKADLIKETKYKNFIYYEINTTVFESMLVWISQFGGKKDDDK
ncbi:MAG: autorepressor SdpR family transcription factor [Culicoidibacterales bacterium]